eukprot:1484429-Prymnesium_polylepis.1
MAVDGSTSTIRSSAPLGRRGPPCRGKIASGRRTCMCRTPRCSSPSPAPPPRWPCPCLPRLAGEQAIDLPVRAFAILEGARAVTRIPWPVVP